MPEKRRKFSPQFKAEAVQLVATSGRPVAEVARELQINEGSLGNWVNTWRRDNPEPVADYIEVFYNRKRLHSSLGYRTPAEALQDHHIAAAAA